MSSSVDSLLTRVSKPARYTGGEWNSVTKDWDANPVRFALAYPDAYDIGMSNMGLGILYDILNKRDGVLAERVYAPWEDTVRVGPHETLRLAVRHETLGMWMYHCQIPEHAEGGMTGDLMVTE